MGAVICASAALLIINNTKSEQDITLDALLSSLLLRKGFCLCLDRFVVKLVDIIYRRIQIN